MNESHETGVDQVVAACESAWQRGDRPDINETLLANAALDRAKLLSELVHLELEQRLSAGEPARVEQYLQRFPELAEDRQATLGLIRSEFEMRRRKEPGLDLAEYTKRFPWCRDLLPTELAAPARPRPGRVAVRLNCPHCQNPIEVVDDRQDAEDVICPSCGSSFKLAEDRTRSWKPERLPRLGKFELLEPVGRGAFGTVYRAHDTELDRIVAVKLPRSGSLATQEDEDRFIREARSVAQLRHSSIVSVFETGRSDQFPYIVSEFIEGVTLSDTLTGQRPSFRESAELIASVAEALQYAHDQGVIHRDVKPSNIMLDPKGQPHLMDFGLARRDVGEITMTLEGQVLGTPAYMSPEQARGEGHRVDGRSDVYSLGVILYELLTGELPFRGNTRMLLNQVLHHEPRSPRSLNDRIPRDLETICLKAMAKESSRRYQMAQDLANDLQRYMAGEPIQARPIGRVERTWRWCKRNPVVAGLSMSMVLTLTMGTIIAGYFATDALIQKGNAEKTAADALVQKTRADRQAERAVASAEAAKLAEMRATEISLREKVAREAAEQQTRRVTALKLVSDSRSILETDPQLATLCAIEAIEVNSRRGESHSLASEQALREALLVMKGRPLYRSNLIESISARVEAIRITQSPLQNVRLSPDGRWLVRFGEEPAVSFFGPEGQSLDFVRRYLPPRLVDLSTSNPLASARAIQVGRSLQFTRDGRWLLADDPAAHAVSAYDLAAADPSSVAFTIPTGKDRPVQTVQRDLGPVQLSSDGRCAITFGDDSMHIWDMMVPDPPKSLHVLPIGGSLSPGQWALSEDHHWLVTATSFPPDSGRIRMLLWDLTEDDPKSTARVLFDEAKMGGFDSLTLSCRGHWLVTKHVVTKSQNESQAQARLWDLSADDPSATDQPVHQSGEFTLAGRWLIGGSTLWDLTRDNPIAEPIDLGDNLKPHNIEISPNQRWIFTRGLEKLAQGAVVQSTFWDLTAANPLTTAKKLPVVAAGGVFSTNDRLLVTLDKNTARIWDLDSEAPAQTVLTCRGQNADIREVSVTPDGQRIVTSSESEVRVTELADYPPSGAIVLRGHKQRIAEASFTPDGQRLVTTSRDGTVCVWDRASFTSNALPLTIRTAYVAQLSADGRWLVTQDLDGSLRLRDLCAADPKPTIHVLKGLRGTISSMVISPDGHWVAVATIDARAFVWDTLRPDTSIPALIIGESSKNQKEIHRTRLAMDRAGRWLAVGFFGGSVQLVDLARLDQPTELAVEFQYSNGPILMSQDGCCLVASGDSLHGTRTTVAWDLKDRSPAANMRTLLVEKELRQFDEMKERQTTYGLAMSPDGNTLVVVGRVGKLHICNLKSANNLDPAGGLTVPGDSLESLAVTPNSRWLVAGDGIKVSIWELGVDEPARSERVFQVPGIKLRYLTTSADGRWLVTCGDDHNLRIFPVSIQDLVDAARQIVGRELTSEERLKYEIPADERRTRYPQIINGEADKPDQLGLMNRFMGRREHQE